MQNSRLSNGGHAESSLLYWIVGFIVVAGIGVAVYLMQPAPDRVANDSTAQTTEVTDAAKLETATAGPLLNALDFTWPTLIEHLRAGSLQGAVKSDEAVFILYYLKEMNEDFNDPDMKVFIDTQCLTRVYDAEMSARLQSVRWTKVIPTAVSELGALLQDQRDASAVLAERYPILFGALQDLTQDLPAGTLDRLFILRNLPRILKAKAQQDSLVLFSQYGCMSGVTTSIYSHAVKFVKAYDTGI